MPNLIILARTLALGLTGLVLIPYLFAEDPRPAIKTIPLKGHTELVYGVAMSPDGSLVATASFDRTIKVWDALTGKVVKTFGGGTTGHQNQVLAVDINRDGTLLASASADNTARIWDFPGSKPFKVFPFEDAVTSIKLNSDGSRAVAGLRDGSIRVWNPIDGNEVYRIAAAHKGGVDQVAFASNGQTLASIGADKMVRFWNATNGMPQGEIGAHTGLPTGVMVNGGGNQAVTTGEDGTVKVWTLPLTADRKLATPPGDAITALALTADGSGIITGSSDKQARLYNVGNGQLTRAFIGPTAPLTAVASGNNLVAGGTQDARIWLWNPADGKSAGAILGHAGAVTGLAFAPAGNQMASTGADGVLKIWSLPLSPSRVLTSPDAVLAQAATADGKKLYTAGADSQILAWNLSSPQQPERKFTGHVGAVQAVAVSPNGSLLASGGKDEVIRFWNSTNSQVTDTYGGHTAAVSSLALTSSNQLLSTGADGSIKLWQAPGTASAVKTLTHPDTITSATLSADGTSLLTGNKDKQVRVWNLEKGDSRSLATLASPVIAVAFLDKAGQVAGGTDKSLVILNLADGKEQKKWADLPANLVSLAGSRDGKQVALGLADGSVRLFDVAQGKEIRSLTGHKGPVNVLHYAAGGELVSGSADKTVKVWDTASGTAKSTLDHEGAVTALAQTKDGRLLTGSSNKTLKFWNLPEGKASATVSASSEIRSLSISPDGTRIGVGGSDGRTTILDADGKTREFLPGAATVMAVGFAGDGKRVVSVAAEPNARLWAPRLIWQANGSAMQPAVISASGDRVVSGDDQGMVKIWQGSDGKNLLTQKAHTAAIVGLAISADGTRIASIGADKMVQLWNVPNPLKPTDKELTPVLMKKLTTDPTAVALSPDGKRLAIHSLRNGAATVAVVDTNSGLEYQAFNDHTDAVRSLHILSDNRTLLTASQDKTVRINDINCQWVIDAHTAGTTHLAFSAPNTAVTAGQDKLIKIWDTTQNKLIKSQGPLSGPITAFALTKDATQVGVALGKEIKVLTLADGKEIAKLTAAADVSSLAFSGDKARVIAGCGDQQARVYDLATGQQVQFFFLGESSPLVTYHPGNTQVVTTTPDKSLVLHTLSLARSIAAGSPLRALALTADGKVITAGDDKTAKIWNLSSGVLEKTLEGAEQPVKAVAIAKYGTLCATAGVDQTVRIYTLADGKLIGSFKGPAAVQTLAFSPNNTTLGVGYLNNLVQTWSIPFTPGQPKSPEFGLLQMTYAHDGPVTDLVFSADGSQLWSSSLDKSVRIWKSPSDKEIRNLPHPAIVDAVAFNPMSDLVASGCHDGKLRIFDGTKGTLVKEINAHPFTSPSPPNPIYALTWTGDGKQIVTGSFDHSAKLWDATSGAMIREFKGYKEKDFEKGHRDGIFCVALSPDGKTLATGSSDRSIKLWNVADGVVIKELVNPNLKASGEPAAHPGWIYGVRFSPDGKQLFSISGAPRNRGSLATWDVTDGKLLTTQDTEGPLYSLALTRNGKAMVLGTGLSVPAEGGQEINISEVVPLGK